MARALMPKLGQGAVLLMFFLSELLINDVKQVQVTRALTTVTRMRRTKAHARFYVCVVPFNFGPYT